MGCVDSALDGLEITAFDFVENDTFTGALSLRINCATHDEGDDSGDLQRAGEQVGQCRWLSDRYGVSFQVVRWFILISPSTREIGIL